MFDLRNIFINIISQSLLALFNLLYALLQHLETTHSLILSTSKYVVHTSQESR